MMGKLQKTKQFESVRALYQCVLWAIWSIESVTGEQQKRPCEIKRTRLNTLSLIFTELLGAVVWICRPKCSNWCRVTSHLDSCHNISDNKTILQ